MTIEEDFSEKIKRHLYEAADDWGKFFISGLLIFFGGRKFSREISDLSETVSEGSEVATRATWRLFNYNVVGWIVRPLLSVVIIIQALLFALGITPIVALRYSWMTLAYGSLSMLLLSWLIWRRIRVAHVIPVTSLEDLKADDPDFTPDYGPDGRFSIRDFIGLPIVTFCMGALTVFVAMLTKSLYNTSVIIVWMTGFTGLLSIGFAFLQFKLILGLAKMVIGGPLDWVESFMGGLVRTFLHLPIPFITAENIGDLLPRSAVRGIARLTLDFEDAYKRFLVPVQLLLAFGAITMCLWLTTLVALIFVGYTYVVSAFIGTGDDGLNKTAKNNTIWATRLVGGSLLLTMLVYRIVEAFLFGLHAVPSYDSVPVLFSQLVNAIKASYILLLIVLFALVMAIKRLDMVKKMEDSHITLTKIVRGILVGVVLVLLLFVWSPWTGVQLTMQDTYWRRFEHTADEALYCLNGEQDFDEVYTDIGPSCSLYRRQYGDPNRRIAAQAPLSYEENACGNPLQCGLRSASEAWSNDPPRPPPLPAKEVVVQSSTTSVATPIASSQAALPATVAMGQPIAHAMRTDKAATPVARPSNFSDLIAEASRQYGVDADLIRAVIRQESNFDPNVTGAAGEWGLMQLMPRTAAGVGLDRAHAYEPRANIMAGTRVLRSSLNACREDIHCTLSRYNGGPRGMHSWRAQRYAGRVMSRYNNYRAGQGLPQVYVAASSSSPRASREVANEPREVAMADLTVDASDCANFSNAARDVMRSIGRCR